MLPAPHSILHGQGGNACCEWWSGRRQGLVFFLLVSRHHSTYVAQRARVKNLIIWHHKQYSDVLVAVQTVTRTMGFGTMLCRLSVKTSQLMASSSCVNIWINNTHIVFFLTVGDRLCCTHMENLSLLCVCVCARATKEISIIWTRRCHRVTEKDNTLPTQTK